MPVYSIKMKLNYQIHKENFIVNYGGLLLMYDRNIFNTIDNLGKH